MNDPRLVQRLSDALLTARQTRRPGTPLTEDHPGLPVVDAYAITPMLDIARGDQYRARLGSGLGELTLGVAS